MDSIVCVVFLLVARESDIPFEKWSNAIELFRTNQKVTKMLYLKVDVILMKHQEHLDGNPSLFVYRYTCYLTKNSLSDHLFQP